MDRIDAMRVFTRVVELRSFTAAADSLQLPRPTVSHAVQQLESRLGLRLLQRTTRQVRPTPEGEAYHARCLRLLADFEEAEAIGQEKAALLQGPLRVDMHSNLAASLVVPALPDFMARYPGIALEIGTGDRFVDLLREGVDCVLRGGTLKDSSLVARKLADMPQITCASPAYLQRQGVPTHVDALQADGHRGVRYLSQATGRAWDMEFTVDGSVRSLPLPASLTVHSTEAYLAAAVAGLGLIQLPGYGLREHLDAGRLQEVLAEAAPPPLPLWAVYPHARLLSPRVRVFVDWVADLAARAYAGTDRTGPAA